jgi:hypothetical protein
MLRRIPDKFVTIVPVLTRIATSDPDLSTRMAAISVLGSGAVHLPSDSPSFRQAVELICLMAGDDEFYVRQVKPGDRLSSAGHR